MIVRLQLSFDWLVLSLPLSLSFSLSFPVSPSGYSLVDRGLLVVVLGTRCRPLLSCGPVVVVHYFLI